MRAAAYTYSCPPDRIRSGVVEGCWCDGLPCRGHRATRDMVAAAKVLAWSDGLDWDDRHTPQRAYLTKARAVLAELGYITGRPR